MSYNPEYVVNDRPAKRALEVDGETVGRNILINRIHDCYYKSLFSHSCSPIFIKYFEVVILLLFDVFFLCCVKIRVQNAFLLVEYSKIAEESVAGKCIGCCI